MPKQPSQDQKIDYIYTDIQERDKERLEQEARNKELEAKQNEDKQRRQKNENLGEIPVIMGNVSKLFGKAGHPELERWGEWGSRWGSQLNGVHQQMEQYGGWTKAFGDLVTSFKKGGWEGVLKSAPLGAVSVVSFLAVLAASLLSKEQSGVDPILENLEAFKNKVNNDFVKQYNLIRDEFNNLNTYLLTHHVETMQKMQEVTQRINDIRDVMQGQVTERLKHIDEAIEKGFREQREFSYKETRTRLMSYITAFPSDRAMSDEKQTEYFSHFHAWATEHIKESPLTNDHELRSLEYSIPLLVKTANRLLNKKYPEDMVNPLWWNICVSDLVMFIDKTPEFELCGEAVEKRVGMLEEILDEGKKVYTFILGLKANQIVLMEKLLSEYRAQVEAVKNSMWEAVRVQLPKIKSEKSDEKSIAERAMESCAKKRDTAQRDKTEQEHKHNDAVQKYCEAFKARIDSEAVKGKAMIVTGLGTIFLGVPILLFLAAGEIIMSPLEYNRRNCQQTEDQCEQAMKAAKGLLQTATETYAAEEGKYNEAKARVDRLSESITHLDEMYNQQELPTYQALEGYQAILDIKQRDLNELMTNILQEKDETSDLSKAIIALDERYQYVETYLQLLLGQRDADRNTILSKMLTRKTLKTGYQEQEANKTAAPPVPTFLSVYKSTETFIQKYVTYGEIVNKILTAQVSDNSSSEATRHEFKETGYKIIDGPIQLLCHRLKLVYGLKIASEYASVNKNIPSGDATRSQNNREHAGFWSAENNAGSGASSTSTPPPAYAP